MDRFLNGGCSRGHLVATDAGIAPRLTPLRLLLGAHRCCSHGSRGSYRPKHMRSSTAAAGSNHVRLGDAPATPQRRPTLPNGAWGFRNSPATRWPWESRFRTAPRPRSELAGHPTRAAMWRRPRVTGNALARQGDYDRLHNHYDGDAGGLHTERQRRRPPRDDAAARTPRVGEAFLSPVQRRSYASPSR